MFAWSVWPGSRAAGAGMAHRQRIGLVPRKPFARSVDRLRAAGLRPTRQRLALAKLLFDAHASRHVTAEQLFSEATGAGAQMSLATVYNTLHQFTDAGLLQQVTLEPGRLFFDTNTQRHHHLLNDDDGTVTDIDAAMVEFFKLPKLPQGIQIDRIEVVIHVARPNPAVAAGNDNV